MLNTMKGIVRDTKESLREERRKEKVIKCNLCKGGNMKTIK